MGRFSVSTAALVVVLGLAGSACAQDDDDKASATPSWYERLFPFGKTPAAKPAPPPQAPVKASAASRPPARSLAAVEARAKADYWRRMEICQELRRIAEFKNDEELQRKADQLDERAWRIYLKVCPPPGSTAAARVDEERLQRRLATSGSAAPSLLSQTPRSSIRQASRPEDRP